MGVIGVGYWGKKHVDEYSNLGHEIVASDLSQENLDFCKSNYGIDTVNDYHKILKNNEINALSICTPNSTHHKIAIEALNSGKNILLEKPIATSIKNANEIINLSKSKNLVLLVGHIFRFNNAIKIIRELIREGKLGKIYTINICWTNFEPVFPDRDILFDLGIHPIDILHQIFEENPKNVTCIGKGFRQKNLEFSIINYNIEDHFNESMVSVSIELSWINPIRQRKMIIVGSEKTAIVECVLQKIELISNKSGISEKIKVVPNNTIKDELSYFLDICQKKQKVKPPLPNGEIAKRIIRIIEEANKIKNQ